jgi:uncharacterized protein YdiU (UPF0061 family)
MGAGRAVVRSSLRVFLASEAMHGLGVPTTRALALVVSDDPVMRETVETAAIVTRMSPSFVRFGSFEHWSSRRQPEQLKTLTDYVIDRYYPECREASDDAAAVLNLLRAVTRRTALLMADWQAVGFCHGVMNTDNMSILGLTLDYGPYGFMDGFRLGHVCNHSDSEGRYSWNRQPSVALWNLYRLGGSLHALVPDVDGLRAVLDEFEPVFTRAFHERMAAKLGLAAWRTEDEPLLDDLLKLMDANQADFTLAWRRLADAVSGQRSAFEDLFIDRPAAAAWLDRLLARHAQDGRPAAEVAEGMNGVNPLYVLRNHQAEEAIRAAKLGDAGEIDTLLKLLRNPYVAQPGHERYAALPPDWAGSIEVSCSS